jgi:hypothetical protein
MKPITILLFFFACSNISSDQKAYHYNNKGITSDAIIDSRDQKIICGETSVYTSEKSGTGNKDAFFVLSSDHGKTNIGYSMGTADLPERFERVIPIGTEFVLNGFSGESKNKFLIKTNSKGEAIWGIQSERFRTFDPGDMAMDPSGNVLFITKDPSAEAYHGTLHLVDKDGNCKWSRDMSSIEVMQDIICTQDKLFLISFKQKGAYIDGSTRKKYWMNSFHKVDQSGQIVWSRKFHFDNDLVDECTFSKILEDKSGHLYFMGKIDLLKPRKQNLFITKTDKDGRIIWSNVYTGSAELNFKSGCFDSKGNLILAADGYSKNGGIAFLQLAPDGNILWAKITKSANYEQVISIFTSRDGYEIVWDKLLNFASFTVDLKGRTCTAGVEDLKLGIQKFPLILDEFKGSWDPIEADWKKMDLKLVAHQDVISTSDCQ